MSRQWGTVEERLWGKVDKSGGPNSCWIWKGSTASGYGQIQYNGKMTRVHRLAYELEHGEIPAGMDVCHNCPNNSDNPLCVRPAHLWLGTHKQNMHDRDKKGRAYITYGERARKSKFTEQSVLQVRKLAAEGVKVKDIAETYNVTPTAIRSIVNRVNWKWVA